jgi:hypothetical protein
MLNLNKDICDLARTLLSSTCTHTAAHIWLEKNRHSYVKAMSRCYQLCSEGESGNDINLMRSKLARLRMTVPGTFIWRFEPFASTKGYYLMGIHHSLDAVDSIITRFQKGYSYNDEFFVRSILERKKNEV